MSKQKPLTNFKAEIKAYKQRRELFETFLVSPMNSGKKEFPTIGKFLLSELVNGTISFVGGSAGKVDNHRYYFERGGFEKTLIPYFQEQMTEERRAKIDSAVIEPIEKMIKYGWANKCNPYFDPTPVCEVYEFASNIFEVPHSVSFLTIDVSDRANRTLESLTKKQREQVQGIGKAMRPFIEEDMIYIKKNISLVIISQ